MSTHIATKPNQSIKAKLSGKNPFNREEAQETGEKLRQKAITRLLKGERAYTEAELHQGRKSKTKEATIPTLALRTMNEQEQRIAIAEACGWTHLRVAAGRLWGTEPKSDYANLPHDGWYAGCPGDGTSVPRYLSDLNAMHEAEKVLTDAQYISFHARIMLMTNFYRCPSATATQRAEAFLRTLNLWKGTP